jgi:hypothetical protein
MSRPASPHFFYRSFEGSETDSTLLIILVVTLRAGDEGPDIIDAGLGDSKDA